MNESLTQQILPNKETCLKHKISKLHKYDSLRDRLWILPYTLVYLIHTTFANFMQNRHIRHSFEKSIQILYFVLQCNAYCMYSLNVNCLGLSRYIAVNDSHS